MYIVDMLTPVWYYYLALLSSSNTTRGGAAAARVAHNHEVAGSSPAPATKEKGLPQGSPFFLVL